MRKAERFLKYWQELFRSLRGQVTKGIKRGRTKNKGRRIAIWILAVLVLAISLLDASVLNANPLSVPFIHQLCDTPDDFNGCWACGSTSAVMILAYHGKLNPWPFLPSYCNAPTSNYGNYVSKQYTYSGYIFNTMTYAPKQGYCLSSSLDSTTGTPAYGAYGYIHYSDGYAKAERARDFFIKHGLNSTVIYSPTESIVKAEIDAGRPVWASTNIWPSGHIVVIKGYTNSGTSNNGNTCANGCYIVNDPLPPPLSEWAQRKGESYKYTWAEMQTGSKWIVKAASSQTLSVSLSASPSSGTAPLNGVDLTATVSGTATGTINYTFYCNRNDNLTTIGSPCTSSDPYGLTTGCYRTANKFDNITENPKTAVDACNYPSSGTYTAKVIAERGGFQAEARTTITVNPTPQYTLTVNKAGTGTGTVTAGANCTLNWLGNTGTCTVNSGTVITLTGSATTGSIFAGWSNGTGSASGCSGTGTCSFNITTNSSVTATFNATDTTPPTITITSPTSNPTYSTNQSTINIGGTAYDNVGVTQVTWVNDRGGSGACSGTTSWSCSGITLYSGTNNITVTAKDAVNNSGTDALQVTYAHPTRTLTVASTNPSSGVSVTVSPSDNNGQGSGTTQFTRTYNNGTSVTLTAPSTAGGNSFSAWTGCNSTSGTTCYVTMDANKTVTATFSANPINGVCGSSNGGTFTSAPNTNLCTAGTPTAVSGSGPWTWSCTGSNGGTTANCSANIQTWTVTPSAGSGGTISPNTQQTVNHGSTRQFTVTPNNGYTATIGGTCGGSPSGGASQFTYTTNAITTNCTVTATFSAQTQNTYTVTANAGTGGSISPAIRTVSHGSTTTFTVTPDTGYNISSVTGCNGSLIGNIYTTGAITGNCTVTATFTFIPVSCTYSISPTSKAFNASGGTDSVNVTTQSSCDWTAKNNAKWITITSGNSGAGNGTVNYSVSANPSTKQRTGTMTIAGQTFAVTQKGKPIISATPRAVNFGALRVGNTSTHTVTVKNTGKSDLVITSVDIQGINPDEFDKDSSDCSIVQPLETCTINITFAPAIPFGKKSATMSIASNDPKKPAVKVKLAGIAPPPKITVFPKALNLSSMKVGDKSTGTITVKNTGLSDLFINDIGIEGINSSEFSQTDNCKTMPISQGDSCTITVTFTPSAVGKRIAVMNISSNASKNPIGVKLKGSCRCLDIAGVWEFDNSGSMKCSGGGETETISIDRRKRNGYYQSKWMQCKLVC